MARQEFAITTIGSASLSAIMMTLLQRQVDFVEFRSTRHLTDNGEVLDVRIIVDLPNLAAGDMLVKRLNRLINVVEVKRINADPSYERRAVLMRVSVDKRRRGTVLELAAVFEAKVLEVTRRSVTLEHFAVPEKVEELLEILEPIGFVRVGLTPERLRRPAARGSILGGRARLAVGRAVLRGAGEDPQAVTQGDGD